MSAKFLKWQQWVQRIERDVTTLVSDRRIWGEIRRAWRLNRSLEVPTDMPGWAVRTYGSAVAMAIRRQLDRNPRAVSLANLLRDLADHADLITRSAFVAAFTGPFAAERGASAFQRWDPRGLGHLDPGIPRRDLKRLEEAGRSARELANREIAHADKGGPRARPTWDEIERLIGLVERLTLKYSSLLQSSDSPSGSLLPVRQFNHQTFLQRPWLGSTWKRPRWPKGIVERHGGIWPVVDTLAWGAYLRLNRNWARIVARLRSEGHAVGQRTSPIRKVLEELDLPASDAAVQWVRDKLATLGADWRRPG